MHKASKETTPTIEPLALDIRQVSKIVPFGIRTLRRMDAAGLMPRGFKVGGRKLWRLSDLKLWVQWGFPSRAEFESKLRVQQRDEAKKVRD